MIQEYSWLQGHGYIAAFLAVFLEFAGVPIPGGLALFSLSALAPALAVSPFGLIAVSVLATIAPDTTWFLIGRRQGMGLIEMYCKMTLGSRSCTERTTWFFQRLGSKSLLVAKFVPGLATFATPMAGLSGISFPRFLLWDSLGTLIWSGVLVTAGRSMGIGFGQLWIARIRDAGSRLQSGIAAVIAVYLGMKWLVRAHSGPPVATAGVRGDS